jgi:hypothetical protein
MEKIGLIRGKQQIPPGSLRWLVGMTRIGIAMLAGRNDKSLGWEFPRRRGITP